ncbi:hypothetical protein RFI_11754 [Reticulomyxa filosa]|uniref:N-acetyltransferase domain-containing protein n=1 Tax=Reticulomyxa filosa TaxID=46433 RepID=X6NHP1_RETFI|nr:hypothetical protein RFI_11754 [Reticulomyxa filosa]|eukprot:ETO25383.1 hypothetical protein RFI_11754 [Reticulomyxa filosa]
MGCSCFSICKISRPQAVIPDQTGCNRTPSEFKQKSPYFLPELSKYYEEPQIEIDIRQILNQDTKELTMFHELIKASILTAEKSHHSEEELDALIYDLYGVEHLCEKRWNRNWCAFYGGYLDGVLIVAGCLCSLEEDQYSSYPNTLEVMALFVHPMFFRKNLGSKMLAHLETQAKHSSTDPKTSQLYVASALTSIGFYEKHGFKRQGLKQFDEEVCMELTKIL